jgi:hypothetical protein
MSKNNDAVVIEQLAKKFGEVLQEWLSAEEMKTIIQRNKSGVYSEDVCASHDFCDANMAMDESFLRVLFRNASGSSDHDIYLWDSAWKMAKAADFFFQ